MYIGNLVCKVAELIGSLTDFYEKRRLGAFYRYLSGFLFVKMFGCYEIHLNCFW